MNVDSNTNQLDNNSTIDPSVQVKKEIKIGRRLTAKQAAEAKAAKQAEAKEGKEIERKKYKTNGEGSLVEIPKTEYTPLDLREEDGVLDISKNENQKGFAIRHMVEVRNWKTEWLDKYGIVYLTHAEATTAPYSYSKLFTSPWGGMHFPAGRGSIYQGDEEYNLYYLGQIYNWYPCAKSKTKHLTDVKNVDKQNKLTKYVTCLDAIKLKHYFADPALSADSETKEDIAGFVEGIQDAYKAHAIWGKRFIAVLTGCTGVTNEEINSLKNSETEESRLDILSKSNGTSFIVDNDVLCNFGVFHAAIKTLLYTKCDIKLLSEDLSKKVGLDEFIDSGNTWKDYLNIRGYDFDSFISDLTFNFTKNRYNPKKLFEQVGGSRNGGEKLRKIKNIYYGDVLITDDSVIDIPLREPVRDTVINIEEAISELKSPFNTIYRGKGLRANLLGVIQNGNTCATYKFDEGTLHSELNNLFKFRMWVYDVRAKNYVPEISECDTQIARRMLNNKSNNRLKQLDRVSYIPVLDLKGNLEYKNGYSENTNTIIFLDASKIKPKNRVSKTQALDSAKWLKNVLEEFQFVDPSDLTALLAGLLTGLSRHLYLTAPCLAISAHDKGSGKGALVDLINVTLTGEEAVLMTYSEEEEFNKKLLSKLICPPLTVNIDNIKSKVDNAAFESCLTSGFFTGRLLGRNEDKNLDAQILFTLNGNNLQLSEDMLRRTIMARLNKTVEGSKDFKIKDWVGHLKEIRYKILEHGFNILRAYLQSDTKHTVQYPTPLSSFGDWDYIVRRSLIWLGEPDPLAPINDVKDFDLVKLETRDLLETWFNVLGSTARTVKEIVEAITAVSHDNTAGVHDATQKYALFSLIKQLPKVYDYNGQAISRRHLAKELHKISGVVRGGYRLEVTQDKHLKQNLYAVSEV